MKPIFPDITYPNRSPFNEDGSINSIGASGVTRLMTEPSLVFQDKGSLPDGSEFTREITFERYSGRFSDYRKRIFDTVRGLVHIVCFISYSALGVETSLLVEATTLDGPPIFLGANPYESAVNGNDTEKALWDRRYEAHRSAHSDLFEAYSDQLGDDQLWTQPDPAIVNYVYGKAGSM